MASSSFLFGKKSRLQQIPTVNPQQQQLLDLISQRLQGQLGQPRQSISELFAPIRQQAQQRLQEQGIPSLLNQFAAQGGLGSGQLSGVLGKATSDLEGQLAAQEAQATLGREGQEQQQLLQLLGLSLQPQQQTFYQPGTSGLFGSLAPSAGLGLGLLGTGGLGGLGGGGLGSLLQLLGGSGNYSLGQQSRGLF